ncbi:MAG: SGNH/GDSL hydrolase family protein [Lachnospiraceae bacterium]|nr:SGNH/GDSL hydrolase family protein [Lachnospiraceae bacterium]
MMIKKAGIHSPFTAVLCAGILAATPALSVCAAPAHSGAFITGALAAAVITGSAQTGETAPETGEAAPENEEPTSEAAAAETAAETASPAGEAGGSEGAAAEEAAQPAAAPEQAEASYTPEQTAKIAAYYANTVFAGDSVLLGFRNYCRSGDDIMKNLNFLAAGSLSLHNAFWPVSSKSVHPLYQGEQHPIWESVQMIGPDRVFLFFGINDMAYGVDDSVTKYGEFIAKIKEYRPEAKITLISATYMLEGTEKKNLNNANLAEFNARMAAEAAQNGWGYVDMATATSDGAGHLAPAYCSDGFIHQSKAAYKVWERVLKDYALGSAD